MPAMDCLVRREAHWMIREKSMHLSRSPRNRWTSPSSCQFRRRRRPVFAIQASCVNIMWERTTVSTTSNHQFQKVYVPCGTIQDLGNQRKLMNSYLGAIVVQIGTLPRDYAAAFLRMLMKTGESIGVSLQWILVYS